MKACRECRRILSIEEEKEMQGKSMRCPNCNKTDFSEDFSGMVIIIDPEDSQIAKQLEVTKPGTYALRVR